MHMLKHKALSLIPSTHVKKLDKVASAYNPSVKKGRKEDLRGSLNQWAPDPSERPLENKIAS